MKTVAWSVLVALLFVSTFGLSLCITFFLSIIIFFVGGLSFVYVNKDTVPNFPIDELFQSGGKEYLMKVIEVMKKRKKKYNSDSRLTGSHIIDEELRTILYYVFRDFIYPWYNNISDDQEFLYQLKETAHKIIIVLANRIKEVDWIPYFTTQLVDDAASHLRLYKQARAKLKSSSYGNLETQFFDLELSMEHSILCRDHICLNAKEERCYIQHIAEALLFQLVPDEDFPCKQMRFLAKEVLTDVIILPLIRMFSDPDYVNQTIIWLCSDFPVSSELFLTVLKTTNNADELYATRSNVQKEIASMRCRDSVSDNDMKNQLSSLLYVDKIIDIRLSRLQEGSDRDSTGLPSSADYSKLLSEQKLVQLPLDFILKNSIALSYFIDYMTSVGYQQYVFCYLNMEGWKSSASQELSKYATVKSSNVCASEEKEKIFERFKNAAQLLYEQFLVDKVTPKLIINPIITRSLLVRIHTETPQENWFDDVIQALYNTLQNDERFLKGFRNNPSYVKLLAELELLKEPLLKENDDEDVAVDELPSSTDSSTAGSPVKSFCKDSDPLNAAIQMSTDDASKNNSSFTLTAKIIETGLVQENGKTFGVYAVAVTKLFNNGQSMSWHIYRRYSDFYELHQKLKDKFPDLSNVPFPTKKAFNNMERNLLEKRMKMLNDYLKVLLQIGVVKSHPTLSDMLTSFLGSEYDKSGPEGPLSKTLDNLVFNPLKLFGNAVKTMPDNLLNTVDEMMEGVSRVLQKPFRNGEEEEAMKVSSEIDVESDNIPLRIMMLLMTEVFDLKTRNQWLRKRIIMLLRQIMNAMLGDIVNRRILDYVAVITSPPRVALCLANIKNALWPNSIRAEPAPMRDNDIRMQTRIAAKCALLASLSDELKHILGSETSRTGLMLVFSMFQHEVLNRRLVHVLFEGILVSLFPNLSGLFQKLHAQSDRVASCWQQKRGKPKRV